MKGSPGGDFLDRFLQGERDRVDRALDRAVHDLTSDLPSELRAPIEQGVLAKGKRLRPILCVAGYRAAVGADDGTSALRETPVAVYELAVSLEMIHGYSLMHDDLPCMDDAELRRGEPTTHTLFGEHATLLAGAALIPAAALQAWRASGRLGLPGEARREAVRILTRAAGPAGMVGGQLLDLMGEGRKLSRDELDELHRRKTGALLQGALVLGATAAVAPNGLREALARYGREIGLAFQIADDILDVTADAEALGKNPSDEVMEKSTYVSLLGVDAARAEASERVREAVGALHAAGIEAAALEALARYVVSRDR